MKKTKSRKHVGLSHTLSNRCGVTPTRAHIRKVKVLVDLPTRITEAVGGNRTDSALFSAVSWAVLRLACEGGEEA